jgi:hypothetical protein
MPNKFGISKKCLKYIKVPKMPKVVVRLRRAIYLQGLIITSPGNKVSKVVW